MRRLLVVTVAALVVPTAALAAPPTLVSVGHVEQRPTARWTLPTGVESQLIEIATDPALSTDGAFLGETSFCSTCSGRHRRPGVRATTG